LRGILSGRGFSDQKALLKLLRRYVRPNTRSDPAPIELQFVMDPQGGIIGKIVNEPATTYMKIFRYGGEYFDSRRLMSRRKGHGGAADGLFPRHPLWFPCQQ
jgi:hypothetical protein